MKSDHDRTLPSSTSWGSGRPRTGRRAAVSAASAVSASLALVPALSGFGAAHAAARPTSTHLASAVAAGRVALEDDGSYPQANGDWGRSWWGRFGSVTGRLSAADLAGTEYVRGAGSGVTVAVLDSGVDEVPALAGRVIQGPDFTGQGSQDDYGHGTFVAGLIAGNGLDANGQQTGLQGVAPQASILSVKVANAQGESSVGTVVQALQWVVQNAGTYNIGVINLSLDTIAPGDSYEDSALDAAVEAAWFAGITVVVAAGNTGPGPLVSEPANDPYVLTVGSNADDNGWDRDSDTLSPFTPTGPTADGLDKVDADAPGEHVQAPLPAGSTLAAEQTVTDLPAGYGQLSGTSMAAAEVSGEVAVLLSREPNLTPDQVKGALMASENQADEPQVRDALWMGSSQTANTRYTPSQALATLFPGLAAQLGVSAADSATWSEATWSDAVWSDAVWSDAVWSDAVWSDAVWSDAGSTGS